MRVRDVLILGKLSISLPVGLTAFLGYVLANGAITWSAFLPFFGIFFLSSAASGLNQIQEYKLDALMIRTQKRPIPAGIISPKVAMQWVLLFFLVGVIILSFTTLYGTLWGIAGLIWYNGVYTPLKRVTAFSVFPGAFVGVIPVVAGWMAANGSLGDSRLHFLALFFFIGQMPHFWLLVLKYGKDYQRAGFPTLHDYFSPIQIERINLVWMIATFASAILLTITHVFDITFFAAVLSCVSVLLIGWVVRLYRMTNKAKGIVPGGKLFLVFNSFYLLVMILLSLDKINW